MTLALAFAAPMWIFAHIDSIVGTPRPFPGNFPRARTYVEAHYAS